MLGIIKVQVTGDDTALWTALGALLGVIVGVGASWLLQRSKIGAEKAQLKERLDAEAERVAKQLKHDRDTRELEMVREVLSEASVALGELSRVMLNLVKAKLADAPRKTIDRLQARQHEAARVIRAVGGRLPLWFDADDDVVSRFFDAAETMVEMINHLHRSDPALAGDLQSRLNEQILEYQRVARERMMQRAHAEA